jgi:molybdate transport system ATP-binding protein
VSLHVSVTHAVGAITLDVTLDLPGGLTALAGHSGAGKTTLLHIIAGLIRPDRGRITLDGETLADTARGIDVAPHRRRIGCVFQEPRLFPHLTVRGNLQFGARFAPVGAAGLSLDEVIDCCALAPLAGRRVSRLSGGERQRVALARALAARPRLLLLDEPLASVDMARRETLLPALDRVRQAHGLPMLYVTHNLSEVASRAERVAMLEDGQVLRRFDLDAAHHAGNKVVEHGADHPTDEAEHAVEDWEHDHRRDAESGQR